MIDDDLRHVLKSALPPTVDQGPSRDLWPLVLDRLEARAGWSWLDISLAAAVTIVLIRFPGWLPFVAYHL